MGKPLRLLNLTLGLVVVLIAGALAKTWVAPAPSTPGTSASKSTHEPVAAAFSRTARPPLEHFDLLLDRNPFKQPPPPPPARSAQNRATPPRPLPILSGTILVGDDWRAIVSDKGKAEIYAIGQEVGGGLIVEIKEEWILLKREDATVKVLLKAAIEPGRPPSLQAVPAQPGSVAPSSILPPAVQAAPWAGPTPPPMDRSERERREQEKKAEKERRKQEKKAEKEQRKQLRKQQKRR
ncbi:MAG: hypothetical protein L0191_04300 [Acidobacteria bacterium]|nr:hypothetical protein [Acidobacteriota bacterium]